jgi:murein DD-endopeptidase MepM/ murein hydrolase activator NlpD
LWISGQLLVSRLRQWQDEWMVDRRLFLTGVAGLVCFPGTIFGQTSRTMLSGGLKQGELIIGKTEPGTRIALDGKALQVSSDGGFAFGSAYNQKSSLILDARYADGTTELREVSPVIREYEIQRITGLPGTLVTPPPERIDRIKRESAAIKEARQRDTDVSWFAGGFDWPVSGIVSSLFGSQRILNGEPRAPHLAVDVATPTGTPIHAPVDGIVALVGDYYFDGGFTILDHGHGVSTCYGHQSKQLVNVGDMVARGQIMGEVGQTGRATGPNLHWGMNWFQTDLDPSLSTPTPRPKS